MKEKNNPIVINLNILKQENAEDYGVLFTLANEKQIQYSATTGTWSGINANDDYDLEKLLKLALKYFDVPIQDLEKFIKNRI